MHLRKLFWAAALTGLLVGTAQACPNHSDVTAKAAPRTAKQSALLSFRPRAWAPPARVQPAMSTPVSAGMRVERDPVDGTLSMPQPGRFEQMVEVGERRPVSVTRMPNGRVRAELDESFAEFAVVRLGADGKPRWTCVSGPAGVEQFMKAKPAEARMPAPGTTWEDK